MGKTMLLARQCLYFGLFLNIQSVASQTTVNEYVGNRVEIPCGVGGSYTLPQWSKGAVSLTNQDVPGVNPAYPRFSYDTDMRTLVVSPAQEDDSGTYECTHTGGTTPPQNTIVVITEEPSETNNGENVQIANCVLFVLAIVVVTVVIIMCVYIVIKANQQPSGNKNKDEMEKEKDKQNENTKEVKVILIVAAVLFITVSVFFIVMQTIVEDFEKLTEKEHIANIALLVVESVVFVLGVIAIIFLIWKICRDD